MDQQCSTNRYFETLVAALTVLLVAWAAGAAEGATIHGQVLDVEERPVALVRVQVIGTELETVTGEDGRFEFVGVSAGDYRLRARGHGFTIDSTEPVSVAGGDSVAEVIFRLDLVPTPLREIVVTSSISILREQPVATVALDRREIMELPHFGDDLYRAVAVLPGTSGGDISARFSIRGGLDDETLVRLDDMELFEPFHLKDFQGVFSVLDPEMIGGVELLPGGFTAEYGDRSAGVLDMSTREPTTNHGSLGISFSNAWANTGGRFADGKGSWLGSVRRGYLDMVLEFAGRDDEDDGDPPDPRYWDALVQLGFDPGPSQSVSLQVLAADDDLIFREDEADELTDVTTGYGSSYVWLRHLGVVGMSSFVSTVLYGGRVTTDRDLFGLDYGEDERLALTDVRELDLYGIRQDWQHELSDRHYLRWGIEARSYDVSYDYDNDSLIEDPIDDPRFQPGERITSFHDTYGGEWYALYATDRMRLGKRLTVEMGARFDRQTLSDEDHLSPRVNLLYDVFPNGVFRLGWGQYYQSQRPYELDVAFGEIEFQEDQCAEHWTAGYEADLGQGLRLRVDAYLREVSDPQSRWETLFDPFHPAAEIATDVVRIAPEAVTSQGIEVYLAGSKGGRFDWWLSYAYSSIEEELDGVDTPRYNDQPHAFTASASWRPGPKWSLTGVWTYHTGWPTTAVAARLVPGSDGEDVLTYTVGRYYQERLDDYHRLDVRASRTTRVGRRGRLTFFIDIQNLYNRDNLRGYAVADPDYSYSSQSGLTVSFPEEYWLPIIPSFGVSWEF